MKTVKLLLDSEEVELRPSSRAAIAISRHAGGFVPALERVGKFDEDLIVGIIALGLDAEPDAIADKVARTGVAEFAEPASEFIYLLINGGKTYDEARHWAEPS